MEQDGEEDSCRFVYEVNSIGLVSYNGAGWQGG